MKKADNKLRTTTKDFYDDFISQNPDSKITKQTYSRICKTLNLLLASYIIKTGEYIRLPFNLGLMGVGKKKRILKFNYQGFDDQNNPLKDDLKHSEGYAAKLRWVKQRKYGHTFKYPDIWDFRFSKKIRKALKDEIINNNSIKKYYPYE